MLLKRVAIASRSSGLSLSHVFFLYFLFLMLGGFNNLGHDAKLQNQIFIS